MWNSYEILRKICGIPLKSYMKSDFWSSQRYHFLPSMDLKLKRSGLIRGFDPATSLRLGTGLSIGDDMADGMMWLGNNRGLEIWNLQGPQKHTKTRPIWWCCSIIAQFLWRLWIPFSKKPMKNQAISQPLQPSHTPCDPTISLPPYRHWGLPYNMPAHSLQRSQYVNGLAELTPEIRASGEWRALSAKCGMSETCCLYINSLYWWLLVYINDY